MPLHRWFTALAVILVSLGAAPHVNASGEEPAARDVKRALQDRLDAWFENGLFRIRTAEPIQAQPHDREEGAAPSVLVRYRAEIRLQRDYDLTRLDVVNVGTLIDLLGSTPRGLGGIDAHGNHRGDLLRVEGSLLFSRAGSGWRAVLTNHGLEEPAPAATATEDAPMDARIARRLSELGAAIEGAEFDEPDERFGIELDQLVADVECRMAGQAGRIRLGTGSPTTEYHALGLGLAELMNGDGERLHPRETTGSVDNVLLLHDGIVDVAFVQSDVAHLAYHGQGQFQGKLPMTGLRALGALFPEAIHLVTMEGSGILSLEDLRGQAVDVGPDDSGTRTNAAQLLALNGLALTDLDRVQGKPPGEALDDLVAGRVKAAFLTGVSPYPQIARRARELPIRLVPLTSRDVEAAARVAPFLTPMILPQGTYAGQQAPVQTLGVFALVLASQDLEEGEVEALLAALMTGQGTLARHSLQAYFITPETAEEGLTVPLHPAAVLALEELQGRPSAPPEP